MIANNTVYDEGISRVDADPLAVVERRRLKNGLRTDGPEAGGHRIGFRRRLAFAGETLPKEGATKKDITITAKELRGVLQNLKQDLLDKKQASEHFGRERQKGRYDGVTSSLSNCWQAISGK